MSDAPQEMRELSTQLRRLHSSTADWLAPALIRWADHLERVEAERDRYLALAATAHDSIQDYEEVEGERDRLRETLELIRDRNPIGSPDAEYARRALSPTTDDQESPDEPNL